SRPPTSVPIEERCKLGGKRSSGCPNALTDAGSGVTRESMSLGWFMVEAFCPTDRLDMDRDKCRDCTTWYSAVHERSVRETAFINQEATKSKRKYPGGPFGTEAPPARCRFKTTGFPQLQRLPAGIPPLLRPTSPGHFGSFVSFGSHSQSRQSQSS